MCCLLAELGSPYREVKDSQQVGTPLFEWGPCCNAPRSCRAGQFTAEFGRVACAACAAPPQRLAVTGRSATLTGRPVDGPLLVGAYHTVGGTAYLKVLHTLWK